MKAGPERNFWTELAWRMGLGGHFPWNMDDEIVADLLEPLEPCAVTLEQLKHNPYGVY